MAATIWSGLVLGAVYVLVATGFSLTLLPTGIFNFAQGAIVIGGSYFAYEWLHVLGLPAGVALVLNAVLGAAAGLACELLAVRPLRRGRSSVGASVIVTTIGASTAIIGALGVKWGYQPLEVPFAGPTGSVHVFGIVVSAAEITAFLAAIIIPVALQLWFRLTRQGQACLAVAEDREAATLRGVNVNVLSLVAFAAAGALGGLVGAVTGPITYAVPTLGTTLALGGFVALALGGEGNFLGGLAGGLLVGLASSFAGRYLQASYSDLAVLAVLVLTLVIRPKGLGGSGSVRSV